MLEEYNTIENQANAEIVEKKSRFIATVRSVSNEEEARAFVEEIRKQYWDARHHVFAYCVGLEQELQRQSDDGEPQGTGGMPVLQVLTGYGLKNTIVVITRYFGGTLLGTGGLVRAYGKAAKEGLLVAGIVKKVLLQKYILKADYSLLGKLRYELEQGGYIIDAISYTEQVEITVFVKIQECGKFNAKMIEAANGKLVIEEKETFFGTLSTDLSEN